MYIFIGSATPKNGDEQKFMTKYAPKIRIFLLFRH